MFLPILFLFFSMLDGSAARPDVIQFDPVDPRPVPHRPVRRKPPPVPVGDDVVIVPKSLG